jgi:hypothetical protein
MPTEKDPQKDPRPAREAKLAQALRDNLRRRKAATPVTQPSKSDGDH